MTREELLSAADTLSRVGAEHDAVSVRRAIARLDNWHTWFQAIRDDSLSPEQMRQLADRALKES